MIPDNHHKMYSYTIVSRHFLLAKWYCIYLLRIMFRLVNLLLFSHNSIRGIPVYGNTTYFFYLFFLYNFFFYWFFCFPFFFAILCDKVCQWLAVGRWFSPSTPVSSTNKTDRHDITKILLKVALNTISLTMFSRCWVRSSAIYQCVMNQIICIFNLLSGRFLQKRVMCTKLDIYVSVLYGQPTLLIGRECVSIVWRISHTSYT